MEKENEKPLLVSENCPPIDYVIIGFTKNDIGLIALCGLIGTIIGIAIYAQNGNSIIAVALVVLTVIVAISIFRRDQYTENLLDKLRIIWEYHQEVKIYEYVYINIWEQEKKRGDERSRKKIIG